MRQAHGKQYRLCNRRGTRPEPKQRRRSARPGRRSQLPKMLFGLRARQPKTEEADKTVAGMLAGLTHARLHEALRGTDQSGQGKNAAGGKLWRVVSPKLCTRCTAMPGLGQTSTRLSASVGSCSCLLALAVWEAGLITRSRRFDWDFFFCSGLGAHQLNKARVELDCFLPGPLLRQRCLPGNSWMDGSGKRMKRKLPAVLHRPARSDAALAKSRRSPFLAMAQCQQQSLQCLQKKNVDLALACRLIRSCIGVARKATSTVLQWATECAGAREN